MLSIALGHITAVASSLAGDQKEPTLGDSKELPEPFLLIIGNQSSFHDLQLSWLVLVGLKSMDAAQSLGRSLSEAVLQLVIGHTDHPPNTTTTLHGDDEEETVNIFRKSDLRLPELGLDVTE